MLLPPMEALHHLAKRVESTLAKRGWGEINPSLSLFFAWESGTGVEFEVRPFPVQPGEVHEHAGEAIMKMRMVMQRTPPPLRMILRDGREAQGFQGLLFACEAWGIATEHDLYDEVHPADNPHGKEMRTVFIIDRVGRMVTVDRIRGDDDLLMIDNSGPDQTHAGQTLQDLRDMMVVICTMLPFGSADLDKLKALDFHR